MNFDEKRTDEPPINVDVAVSKESDVEKGMQQGYSEDGDRKMKRRLSSTETASIFMQPERVNPRRRQVSSSDILRKMNEPAIMMSGADLKLAEQVAEKGTESFRGKQKLIIEEKELPDGFVLNLDGLTLEEAAELLRLYGPNSLPEKITPKWLIFLQLLYQPMPIMIWLAIIIHQNLRYT